MSKALQTGETATVEYPRGTVGPCTADDFPALVDLYCSVFPQGKPLEWAESIKATEVQAWGAYRDGQGRIRVAMLVLGTDGAIWLLADPREVDSEEVRQGVRMLAADIQRSLSKYGVTELAVTYNVRLEPLCEVLAAEGFFGKPVAITRVMRFSESGKVARST